MRPSYRSRYIHDFDMYCVIHFILILCAHSVSLHYTLILSSVLHSTVALVAKEDQIQDSQAVLLEAEEGKRSYDVICLEK